MIEGCRRLRSWKWALATPPLRVDSREEENSLLRGSCLLSYWWFFYRFL